MHALLHHPSVPALRDAVEVEGDVHLVFDYGGRPLADFVYEPKTRAQLQSNLDLAEAALKVVYPALLKLKQEGYSYNDLKVTQLLLSQREGQPDEVKLVDFGGGEELCVVGHACGGGGHVGGGGWGWG